MGICSWFLLWHAQRFRYAAFGTGQEGNIRNRYAGSDAGSEEVSRCYFNIFVASSLDELKHRLMKRGTEEMDEQQLRLLRSLQELDYLREYHFFVVNVEVNQAVENIMKILSLVDFVVTEDRARTMVESLRKGGILMKQVTLEELERITGLPRYAVVVAVGLTAKKIQKEVLSHSPTYEVPVERAFKT